MGTTYSPIQDLELGISSGEVPVPKAIAREWYIRDIIPGLIFNFKGKLYWNHSVWASFCGVK